MVNDKATVRITAALSACHLNRVASRTSCKRSVINSLGPDLQEKGSAFQTLRDICIRKFLADNSKNRARICHGTGGDADDRQGNEACLGDGAGFQIWANKPAYTTAHLREERDLYLLFGSHALPELMSVNRFALSFYKRVDRQLAGWNEWTPYEENYPVIFK
jgi:hypothetical protein